VRRYQTSGSGLGLYISKNIIEKSGGKIGFVSCEGKGSMFGLNCPLQNQIINNKPNLEIILCFLRQGKQWSVLRQIFTLL